VETKKVWKTYKNISLIQKMDKICFPDEETPLIGKREYHWWIVYLDKVPIAYAGAREYLSFFFLTRVGVLPEYRGNGIQKMLIASRVDFSKSLNIREVITYTSKCNSFSISNLKLIGFEIWKEQILNFGDDFLYWKLLV